MVTICKLLNKYLNSDDNNNKQQFNVTEFNTLMGNRFTIHNS